MADDDERYDELMARFHAWIEACIQREEAELLATLDDGSESPGFIYQPDTEHPFYAEEAGTVRRQLARRLSYTLMVAKPLPLAAMLTEAPEPFAPFDVPTHRLEVKRAWGPAPHVGRPFVYMWDVAVDRLNRWVAGPTRIEYL